MAAPITETKSAAPATEAKSESRPEDAAALAASRKALDEAAQLVLLLLGQVTFRSLPRTLRLRAAAWLQDQAQVFQPGDRE